MRFGIFAGVLVAASVVPAAAMAQSKFGGQGQLVISDDQPLGMGTSRYVGGGVGATTTLIAPTLPASQSLISFEFASVGGSGNNGAGGGTGTGFGINPAADYFVIPNLSVGGQILFNLISVAVPTGSTSFSITSFGIAPRVGYNIPITDMISFWPKLDFEYQTASVSNNGGSQNAFSIGIYAPFVITPVQHFFFGIGPSFGAQLSNSVTAAGQNQNSVSGPKVVEFGIAASFGGWFLGD
jgi:hypothetical protein